MASSDDRVMEALQEAHDANATASELWHKQEHEFKVGALRVKKLGKWFDKRHKLAAGRQHDLRRHIMRLGGTVETNLGDTSYTPDVKDSIKAACEVLDDLRDKQADLLDAAREANDNDTLKRFQAHARDIDKGYHQADQKLRAIEELGLPLFIAKHS